MAVAELQTEQLREAAIRSGFTPEMAEKLVVLRSARGQFKAKFTDGVSDHDRQELQPWLDSLFRMTVRGKLQRRRRRS